MWYSYTSNTPTTPTTGSSYRICTFSTTCSNSLKYQTTEKQCTSSCAQLTPPQYIYDTVGSACHYYCQTFTSQKIWYKNENNENECLRTDGCPQNESYKYFLSDTFECQDEICENLSGKYSTNSQNSSICDPVDLCKDENSFYPNEISEYVNVCITECQYVWYRVYSSSLQREQKVCDLNNGDVKHCPPSQERFQDYNLISGSQCVKKCKDGDDRTLIYVSYEKQNVCVDSCGVDSSSEKDINKVWYLKQEDRYCTDSISCPPADKQEYQYQNGDQCKDKCEGDYVYQYNNNEEVSLICNDTCKYYFDNDKPYCKKEDKCDEFGGQYPYEHWQKDRQCDSKCLYDGEDGVWIYKEDTKTRKCIQEINCNSEQQTIYHVDNTRQCVETTNINQTQCPTIYYLAKLESGEYHCIECKSDNEKYNLILQNTCVDKCNTQYPYINENTCMQSCLSTTNKFVQSTHCVQDCGQDEHQKSYLWIKENGENVCLESTEQCPEGKYIKQDDPLTNECVECTLDQDTYKYIQEQYCVEVCTGDYHYIKANTNNVCVTQCKYDSLIQAGSNNQCVTDCNGNVWMVNVPKKEGQCQAVQSCSELAGTITVQGQEKECTYSCQYAIMPSAPETKYYRQNNVCVLECTGDYAYPHTIVDDNENVCSDTCTYKIEDEKRICTLSTPKCDNDDYYIEPKGKQSIQCITLNGGECPNSSHTRYYKDEQLKGCLINNCGYDGYYYIGKYDKDAHNCITDCTKSWFIYPVSEDIFYVCDGKESNQPSCPPQNIDNDEYISKLVKIDQANQCLQRCIYSHSNSTYVSFDNSDICVDNCDQKTSYYIQDGFLNDLQCTNQQSCPPNGQPQLIKIFNDVCVYNCTYFGSISSINDVNQCTTQCTPLIWKYVDGDKQCRLECYKDKEYYVIISSQEGKCIDEQYACPEATEKVTYYKDDKLKICQLDHCANKNAYYINKYEADSHECTLKCENVWFMLTIEQNKQVRVCAQNVDNCLDLEDQDMPKYADNKQCTELCSDNVLFKVVSQDDDNLCIMHCFTTWKLIEGEQKCQQQNKCNDNELILDDTNQCIDGDNCPTNYDLQQENNICQRDPCTISSYFYVNKYSERTEDNKPECIRYCDNIWYIYNVSEDKQVNICDLRAVDLACPPTNLNGKDYEFVSKLVKSTINYQCLEKCMDNLTYSINSYYNDNTCISEYDCKDNLDYRWYQKDENTRKCSHQYYCELIQPSYKLQVDNIHEYCIEQCLQEVWKYQISNGFNIKICTPQCGDYDLVNTVEIDTYQCISQQDICQEQYHLELQYRNTNCQYIKDAKDCSVYSGQQYNDSIYILEETTLCTPCEDDGYKKKTIYDVNYCVEKELLSSGAIAGIVIGVIVLAIIVIVVIIYVANKQNKRSVKKQNTRMDNVIA